MTGTFARLLGGPLMTTRIRSTLACTLILVLFRTAAAGIFTDFSNGGNISFGVPTFGEPGSSHVAQGALPLAIGGSFSSSLGPSGSGLARTTGVFGPRDLNLGYQVGDFLEVSGGPPPGSGPLLAQIGYSLQGRAIYRPDGPFDDLISVSMKVEFHGELAQGDTLQWDVQYNVRNHPNAFPIDRFFFTETITAPGPFIGFAHVPPHHVDLDGRNDNPFAYPFGLADYLVDFQVRVFINKGGSGRSWVVMDDPGVSSTVSINDPVVPEPASVAIWAIGMTLGSLAWANKGGTKGASKVVRL